MDIQLDKNLTNNLLNSFDRQIHAENLRHKAELENIEKKERLENETWTENKEQIEKDYENAKQIADVLKQIVKKHGINILDNVKQCRQILDDFFDNSNGITRNDLDCCMSIVEKHIVSKMQVLIRRAGGIYRKQKFIADFYTEFFPNDKTPLKKVNEITLVFNLLKETNQNPTANSDNESDYNKQVENEERRHAEVTKNISEKLHSENRRFIDTIREIERQCDLEKQRIIEEQKRKEAEEKKREAHRIEKLNNAMQNIISKYSIEILKNPRTFCSYLKDYTGNENLSDIDAIYELLETPIPWENAIGRVFKNRDFLIETIIADYYNGQTDIIKPALVKIIGALAALDIIYFGDEKKEHRIIPSEIKPKEKPSFFAFDNALQKIISEYELGVLQNNQRCCALLMDFTGDEYLDAIAIFRSYLKSDAINLLSLSENSDVNTNVQIIIKDVTKANIKLSAKKQRQGFFRRLLDGFKRIPRVNQYTTSDF